MWVGSAQLRSPWPHSLVGGAIATSKGKPDDPVRLLLALAIQESIAVNLSSVLLREKLQAHQYLGLPSLHLPRHPSRSWAIVDDVDVKWAVALQHR